jgi:hypothetical protein
MGWWLYGTILSCHVSAVDLKCCSKAVIYKVTYRFFSGFTLSGPGLVMYNGYATNDNRVRRIGYLYGTIILLLPVKGREQLEGIGL